MKVLISVDFEGISGVVSGDETGASGTDYGRARRWMTQDTNAAVEGALKGGASEVVVRDAHCQHSILYEELHPKAHLIRGGPGPLFTLDGLDESFDAVMFVGYHARSGDADGVLSHTYTGSLFDVNINGEPASEARIGAALAGHFGVPPILVTGDDVICREVEGWSKGTEVVVVKEALDRGGANCLPMEEARVRIEVGATRAMGRIRDIPPYLFSAPIHLVVTCTNPGIAARIAYIPSVEREDGRTVSYTASDFLEIHRAFVAMVFLASTVR